MKKVILEWIRDILLAVIIALVVLALFKPVIIQQESMLPNFHPGDYVVTSRQAYSIFGSPERGDIVVFKSDILDENGKNKNLIKRIIGVGGDTVEIIEGYIYVNGEKIVEDYVMEQGLSGEMEAIVIPEGSLFCCGDNRGISRDSRSQDVGLIQVDDVVGKVFVRLYPFSDFKVF